MKQNFSIIVTVKNEQKRIFGCLKSIFNSNPNEEIILVDGDSNDNTLKIAKKFRKLKIIISKNSNLTRDRQLGIDACKNNYAVMIDADQRIAPGDLNTLIKEMKKKKYDVIQAGVKSMDSKSFWGKAENDIYDTIHNQPGERNTLGGSPTIYKKKIFKYIRFDDHVTKTIEDTDFFYKLRLLKKFKIGVGSIKIAQYHFPKLVEFVKKYKWYGKGDAEFCFKNPERFFFMFFHLIIRYPIIYSLKALVLKKFYAIPLLIIHGFVRFFNFIFYFFNLLFKKYYLNK
jgi:glycosyltransferase involved in cell wall biosynthesis